MTDKALQKLEAFFQTGENSLFIEPPSTTIDILTTEKQLGIMLDTGYKTFVKKYGGAYAGIEIFPCSKKNKNSKADQTVLDYTLSFRKSYGTYLPFAQIINKSYVIAMDGCGNPYIITPDQKIKLLLHDTGEIETIAHSNTPFHPYRNLQTIYQLQQ